MISEFLNQTVDLVWGLPLVSLLLLGGLYLMLVSRGRPLLQIFHAFQITLGKKHVGSKKAEGQITHFKALSNALSATIGMGNIAGVAIAIKLGGPGAVFWMWIVAFLGMNTKFFECTLAVLHRAKDYKHEVQGGPMYYMSQTKNKFWIILAYIFAISGLLGTMTIFQINQLTSFSKEHLSINPLFFGVAVASVVAYLTLGGVRRLSRITSLITPLMCLLYFSFCIIVLIMNIEKIPYLFKLIFQGAFQFESAAYGGFISVMLIGVKRALFSNEAGAGTAPMAHSNAKTSEPIAEGLVSMVGPFLDTLIICTCTALVILCYLTQQGMESSSLEYNLAHAKEGVLLTLDAFEYFFSNIGVILLGTAVFLFSFTTILGYSNYCEKCWQFLFKGRKGLGFYSFVIFYSLTIVMGALLSLNDVINVLDIGLGLMVYPNMLFLLWSARSIMKEYHSYESKYLKK